MEATFKYATEQYRMVLESRQVLLDYCKTVSQTDLVNENSSFGRGGSIKNLLVHIANVYEFWIGQKALGKNIVFTSNQLNNNITDIIAAFDQVDTFMTEFIEMFRTTEEKEIRYELNGISNTVSILKLFTHALTHEFHHKGQILSLSRHLGYVPVDTDIIR